MNPEVYMCYLINVRRGNFKKLVISWNKEFKMYKDIATFQMVKKGMREIRKNKPDSDWSNFNIEQLLDFINNYLYWKSDE
jgi:hypothetical protein